MICTVEENRNVKQGLSVKSIEERTTNTHLFKSFQTCTLTWHQFHQHFFAHFLYESLLSSFSLLRVWLWRNFRTKNAGVKCWRNLHLELKVTIFISSSKEKKEILGFGRQRNFSYKNKYAIRPSNQEYEIPALMSISGPAIYCDKFL